MSLYFSKSFLTSRYGILLLSCVVLIALFYFIIYILKPSFIVKDNVVDYKKDSITNNLDVGRIAPHRALYNVSLISKKSSSQIVDLQGKMLFELKRSCDAWITKHDFTLNYHFSDSPPLKIESDFTTYETFDGAKLVFNTKRKRDDILYEEFSGSAVRDINSGSGTILFKTPEGLSYDMPKGSFFPVAHTLEIIDKVMAGEKFFIATIFDGSDGEGPFEVSAFILPTQTYSTFKGKEFDKNLLDKKSWSVRLAFFPMNGDKSVAEYEMNIIIHDNGIVSDMVVEYADFSVAQKLVALEELPYDGCE